MSLQRLIRQRNLARSSHKRGEEMSDALTRLALEAPTDAAARRIFEGRERDARNDPAARPGLLEDDLRHVEAMIGRVELVAHDAHEAAEHYGFTEAAERIEWALDFLADAAEQLKTKT